MGVVGAFRGSDLETGLPLNLDSVALLQWPCDPRDADTSPDILPFGSFCCYPPVYCEHWGVTVGSDSPAS